MFKSLSGLVSVGLLVVLAGCGGGGGGGGGSNPPPPPAPDTTPNGFAFMAQSDTTRSTAVTSNEITVSGISAAAAISVTGGEYSIDGGAFTAVAGTVTNNQRVRVRLNTSDQFSTAASATLNVGGVTGAFTATTYAMDTTPEAFQFQKGFDAARDTWVTSATVTIGGINAPAPITITNGEYSIGGGAFTSVAGTIEAGQVLVIRARAATVYGRAVRARVTVGGVSADLDVIAEVPNYIPDAVMFDGQDAVYLLSNTNRLVFKWSLADAHYVESYAIGMGANNPLKAAWSGTHRRIYLGYGTGAIRYLDPAAANPVETAFATVPLAVNGLADAGNYVVAQDHSGAWATHYVFDSAGTLTDSAEWNHFSREYAWDSGTSRLYFFRDDTSPNDLHYEVIDQANGQIASAGESPYHGAYDIVPPIRLSPTGASVLLGSGDVYSQGSLEWSGSIGSPLADARWMTNGQIVTLANAGSQTLLRRLAPDRITVLEQLSYDGQALRVVGSDARMAVIAVHQNTARFTIYTPSDDSDGDGVVNTLDAFPLDPAASVDTDRDGAPDAWNTGRTQADSTTGLVLDAFPQDSACWLAAHAAGGACNPAATVPNYIPDQITQAGDIVYLLSSANRRVYRWSIATGQYLNPYVVGINQGATTIAPTVMAYSDAHERLYLGYDTGQIRHIATAAGAAQELPFANTARGVHGLAAVGRFLLAQDPSGAWATHYVFDSAGLRTDSAEWNYHSSEYAWDPVSSRVYFFRDDTSPNDLHFEVIDQVTGEITGAGETPYHGDYSFFKPIRVSPGGQFVLIGSGHLFLGTTLVHAGALGAGVTDARWMADSSLVTVTGAGGQTTLRRLAPTTFGVFEQRAFTGNALRVVGTDARMALLVADAGTVRFHIYVPNNDGDGDGVTNALDAFPLDPAASVDSDRDGYPDAWNPGRSQADSTTGLVLDAFPNDVECWLPAHGSGGQCNYGATIPNYTPEKIDRHLDVVYLLSSANRRVYRWSVGGARYLKPYTVGIAQGLDVVAPTKMAIAHDRVYLGYPTGDVRYVPISGAPTEVQFSTTAMAAEGLASIGNFLLAVGGDSKLLQANGVIAAQGVAGYSRDYAWDPVNSRIYWLRDNSSPNDLHYTSINAGTGQTTGSGETPYHGSFTIEPPIRVSADGQFALLGSGDIYNQNGLTWARSIALQVVDARWYADGSLLTLVNSGGQTTLRRLASGNFATLEQLSFAGTALRALGTDASLVIVYQDAGAVRFRNYTPNSDTDGDGVPNTTDAFPTDVAASVDTDRDGYPNAWNAGRSQADSTTGLTLDAFPNDSACWLTAHGSGGVCNPASTVPVYVPESVATRGDVIYLFSPANRRVYRWSMTTAQYLNPYVIGIREGASSIAPTKMAYSSAHSRLYFAYDTGAIRYIDVAAGNGAEVAFAATAMATGGIVAAGNYLVAQDASGGWNTHRAFDVTGALTDANELNYYSRAYAWDPVRSRVYYFRDDQFPQDLHFEVVDQTNGHITTRGETPYHGDFTPEPPLHVAPDGETVFMAGTMFDADTMLITGSIGTARDIEWKDDILVDVDSTDRVAIRNAGTYAILRTYQFTGSPVALAFGTTEGYLVHVVAGTTAFLRLPFYDQDADQIPRWWEQLYGLSDTNAGDATTDLDGDGVNNRVEYQNHSNPSVADTDGDGLDDQQEIVTWHTNPAKADSDGDGLNDQAEVITRHTDPWDTDSDDDGYSDLDEVLYGGDPNDASDLPTPLTTYSQTFEGALNAAWSTPAGSAAPWAFNTTTVHAGARSYRSGAAGISRYSSTKFRVVLAAGTLSYWARVTAGPCCDRLELWVDGTLRWSTYGGTQWEQATVPVGAGLHEFEWRFQRSQFAGSGSEAAWLDDIAFAP